MRRPKTDTHAQAADSGDSDEQRFVDECRQLAKYGDGLHAPDDLVAYLDHITSLLLHLAHNTDTGSPSRKIDTVNLLVLKAALDAVHKLVEARHLVNPTLLPSLVTAAAAAIRDQKALLDIVLAFAQALQPLCQPSPYAASSSSKPPTDFFTSRILPSLVKAFGKAGRPELGERLVQRLAAFLSPQTSPLTLGTVMRTIVQRAPAPAPSIGPEEPDANPPTNATRAQHSAQRALGILRSAEQSRHLAAGAHEHQKRHDPRAPPPIPDLTQFDLGAWSGEPAVWAALIASRLSAGHSIEAEIWFLLYRALTHHRRWALRLLREPIEEHTGTQEVPYPPHVAHVFLPRATQRPYQARIQTVPTRKAPLSKGLLKQMRTKTKHALQAEPDLNRPYQTIVVREVVQAMARDGVDPDPILNNYLITFEASCERFGSAADLVEKNLRSAAGRLLALRERAQASRYGDNDADEDDGSSPLSTSDLLDLLGPAFQGDLAHDPHWRASPAECAQPTTLLKVLGPGFLSALAQMHVRRSKLLASPRFEDADVAELREKGIVGELFDAERHPFARRIVGQTPGDTVALWLELYGSESLAAESSSSSLADRVEPSAEARTSHDEADDEDGHDDEDGPTPAESDELDLIQDPSQPARTKRPPVRSGIWLRTLVDSLMSAPTFQLPHALLLVEHLQRSSPSYGPSTDGSGDSSSGLAAGVHAIGPGFVSGVLGSLLRIGHTHVLRHFRTPTTTAEGGEPGKKRLTVHEESNEYQTTQTVILEPERKPDEDDADSGSREPAKRPLSIHAALHSTTHARRLVQLLGSAILAELKFTAAPFLNVAFDAAIAPTLTPDAAPDAHEAQWLALLRSPTGVPDVLRRAAEEDADAQTTAALQSRTLWTAELLVDERAEVGARVRELAYRLLEREGPLEEEENAGQQTEEDGGGDGEGQGLKRTWDEETRAELLEVVMGQTRAEVQARRAQLREGLPADLLELVDGHVTVKAGSGH